jgi:hypothetical protein
MLNINKLYLTGLLARLSKRSDENKKPRKLSFMKTLLFSIDKKIGWIFNPP